MLPFVLLSWVGGRLADATRRDLIVRVTLAVRAGLLLGAALALVTDHLWVAVAACTLTVTASLPAYPAQVAALPGIAGEGERTRPRICWSPARWRPSSSAERSAGCCCIPRRRELLPWVPVAMTVAALLLVLPVRMPAPGASRSRTSAPSPYAVLRRSLRHACDRRDGRDQPGHLASWPSHCSPRLSTAGPPTAPATGWPPASSGFAALGAPVLRRLGRSAEHSIRWGLLLVAAGAGPRRPGSDAVVVPRPVRPGGRRGVSVEAGATRCLVEHVADRVRATVLGINDTVIVGAALVGSLVAPVAVELLGGALLMGCLALFVALTAWWTRPRDGRAHPHSGYRRGQRTGGHMFHDSPRTTAALDRAGRRAAVRRERLRLAERHGRRGVLPGQGAEPARPPAQVRRPG